MAAAQISVCFSRLELSDCFAILPTDKFQVTVEDASAIFYLHIHCIYDNIYTHYIYIVYTILVLEQF